MVPHVAAHFRLVTFGVPMLVSATNEVVRFRTRKHLALLIRLALEPGRTFVRDYLIDLLWADVPADRGRHSLSQAITALRQVVGREHLLSTRSTLALAEGVVEVDVLRIESGEVEIRGELLEGLDLPGAQRFGHWRDAWAAQMQTRIRDSLVARMNAARRLGDFATVERYARLLQQMDPTSEEAVRGIMEARAWVGDRGNALKTYDRFAVFVKKATGAAPSTQLERMVELLQVGPRAAPRPKRDGVPPRELRRFEAESIIGRQREFSMLYDAWIDVQAKTPRVLVLLGDSGIGKTTLANAFASSCQMEGATIARAQAYDAERELPYAVLAELVRQLTLQRAIGAAEPEALAELSRLSPDVRTVFPGIPRADEWPPEVVPLRLADAFLKAVSAATEDLPVVLIVDDIHAADNASVAILHMLARKLAGLRVMVILTGRPGSHGSPSSSCALATDAMIEGLCALELEPLPADAAAVLAARASMKGVERWGEAPIEHIVRLGGGNPLALELLSREWVESGADSLVGKLDPLHPLPAGLQSISKAISTMVERQTAELAERTRAVFDLAAVLGRRTGDLWLYQVIGCTEGEALYQLGQLLEARLLRDIAGKVEFRNELIRVHAYYQVPSAVRLQLHRRIAEVLEARGRDDVQNHLEIAWHYILGGDRKRGVPLACSGSEQSCRSGAPHEAELILSHIIKEDRKGESSSDVLLLLAKAFMSQSKAEEALPCLESLLSDDRTPRTQIAETVKQYASAMYLLNRNSTAKHGELATKAVELARECGDKGLIAHALLERARAGLESGVVSMISDSRDELRRLVGEPRTETPAIAFHADAFCNYCLLDIPEAAQSAARAVTALSSEGSVAELALAYTGLGNCMTALFREADARKAFDSALKLSRKIGDDSRVSILCSNISACNLIFGRNDAAIEYGEESLAAAAHARSQPVLAKSYGNLAFAYLLGGESSKARECYSASHRWMSEGRSWAITTAYLCDSATLELAFGNQEEALRLIASAERASLGRSLQLGSPGLWDRLRVFLVYHTHGYEPARALATEHLELFKDRHLPAYLESVAALAWLEKVHCGGYSETTQRELALFEIHQCAGKRAALAIQGFLQ